MPRARGRTVVVLLSMLGVIVTLWAAAMYRNYFIETWYLLRLRAAEGDARIGVIGPLARVGSRRSFTALLALVAEEERTPEAPLVAPLIPLTPIVPATPVTPEVVRALFAIAAQEQRGIVNEMARGLGDPRWKVRWRAAQLSGIVGVAPARWCRSWPGRSVTRQST